MYTCTADVISGSRTIPELTIFVACEVVVAELACALGWKDKTGQNSGEARHFLSCDKLSGYSRHTDTKKKDRAIKIKLSGGTADTDMWYIHRIGYGHQL